MSERRVTTQTRKSSVFSTQTATEIAAIFIMGGPIKAKLVETGLTIIRKL